MALTSILIATLRTNSNSSIYKILTWEPVVFIGLISYSLYLWHWSVLAISRWTIGIYWWTIPIQLGLIFALALISYRYIEKPLREVTWSTSRAKTFSYAIGAIIVSAVSLFGVAKASFIERLYIGKIDAIVNQAQRGRIQGTSINPENCSWWLGKGPSLSLVKTVPLCTLGSKAAKSQQRVIVLGDSQAGHLVGLLKHLYFDDNLSIRLLYVHGQVVPLSPFRQVSKERQKDKNIQRYIINKTLADLHQNDIVILSSYILPVFKQKKDNSKAKYKNIFDESGEPISQDAAFAKWVRSLDSFIKAANQKKVKVIFFAPLPEFKKYKDTVPPEVCISEWFRPNLPKDCRLYSDRKELKSRIDHFMLNVKSVEHQNNNFYIYDPFPILCPVGPKCSSYLNGVKIFYDSRHLNNIGGEYLYKDFVQFLETSISAK